MKTGPEEIKKISRLANLDFDQENLNKISSELDEILNFVSSLEEIDLARVPAVEDSSVLRVDEDQVKKFDNKEILLKNAPAFSRSYFLFPSAINLEETNE